MKLLALALTLTLACTPPKPAACPACAREPSHGTRAVCVDDTFRGSERDAVFQAISRWNGALCGTVRLTPQVVDPSDPEAPQCPLTLLRVEPEWQWVATWPDNTAGLADPKRGIAWLIPARAPGRLADVASHELGHLLGLGEGSGLMSVVLQGGCPTPEMAAAAGCQMCLDGGSGGGGKD